MPRARRAVTSHAAAAVCALAWTAAAGAQERGAPHDTHGEATHPDSAAHRGGVRGAVRAQAIGLVTRAHPALDGRTLVEAYLTQPVVMAHAAAAGGRVRLTGTLDLEGLTLRRGQLNAGAYGEGYVDRRHPHTLLHEAVAWVEGAVPGVRGVRASLAAGKGFVAFGTDDPMARPFVLFPVNHHLAQILERALVIGGARVDGRAGAAALEATLFNGDEPAGPWAWPHLDRFGDSWALRATLAPALPASLGTAPGPLELSASVARLASPENPDGGGLDQRKASLAARWASRRWATGRGGAYALAEWARTDEHRGARRAFRYQSVLAEGAVRRGRLELAARAERTGRPEEERLLDLFRTVRPHYEQNVLGITEWRTVTLAAAARLPLGTPFVEVARMAPRDVIRPSTFEPLLFYGVRTLWSVSFGVRLRAGGGRGGAQMRMGRYGVLAERHGAGGGPPPPVAGGTHPASTGHHADPQPSQPVP